MQEWEDAKSSLGGLSHEREQGFSEEKARS